MMSRLVAAVGLVGLLVAPVGAEIRYTTRVDARPSSSPAAAPANPLLALISGLVLGMIAPPGGLEITTIAGALGARVEYDKAFSLVPAGGAMLVSPEGAIVVIDPSTKTYWKVQQPAPSSTSGKLTATANVRRTGGSATIAGVSADHAIIDIRAVLPLPEGMRLPGMPSEVAMTVEAWTTDKYKEYAHLAPGIGRASSLGVESLTTAGFPMRSILRSELFGSQEIEYVVTSIGEVSAPPSAFQIPDGYTETAPQSMLPLGLGR